MELTHGPHREFEKHQNINKQKVHQYNKRMITINDNLDFFIFYMKCLHKMCVFLPYDYMHIFITLNIEIYIYMYRY